VKQEWDAKERKNKAEVSNGIQEICRINPEVEQRYVFVTTGLFEEDKEEVEEFVQTLLQGKCQIRDEVDDSVTHVLVRTEGLRADRTLKYLQVTF